jgi:plastocyanin
MNRSFGALLVVVALGAAGCGGNDNSYVSSPPPAPAPSPTPPASGGSVTRQTLILQADPGGALKFDRTTLTASPGTVKIVLKNPSQAPHAIELEGNGVEKVGKTVTKGGTSEVTAKLKTGTYEYYCPVDDHKQAGMEGKLTVK